MQPFLVLAQGGSFQICDIERNKRITLRCFKSLHLWQSVTVGIGNPYNMCEHDMGEKTYLRWGKVVSYLQSLTNLHRMMVPGCSLEKQRCFACKKENPREAPGRPGAGGAGVKELVRKGQGGDEQLGNLRRTNSWGWEGGMK